MNKLVGHKSILKELIHLYDNKIIPNKILLSGNKGIGKSLLVNHFLKYIYSKENSSNSEKLIDQGCHPNIFKISKNEEKKNIEISKIREMINFQNHSSFNNFQKTIVINDIEFLNLNSTNALLKTLEEPNGDDMFILISNSNSNILETIKSRCIEFKLSLTKRDIIDVVNNYFGENIYDQIPIDFLNSYVSPSFFISLINFFNENDINYKNITIENFLLQLIKDKFYSKNLFIKENLNLFIELFFYKNISITKKISFKTKDYFYLKFHQIKNYNLDIDSYFMEFEEKLLSE